MDTRSKYPNNNLNQKGNKSEIKLTYINYR